LHEHRLGLVDSRVKTIAIKAIEIKAIEIKAIAIKAIANNEDKFMSK
jgi:hypothetical protein